MIRGVVFDLDGVLADTEPVYQAMRTEYLSRFGVTLTPEQSRAFTGLRSGDAARGVAGDRLPENPGRVSPLGNRSCRLFAGRSSGSFGSAPAGRAENRDRVQQHTGTDRAFP